MTQLALDRDELQQQLAAIIGPQNVSRRQADLVAYSHDLWPLALIWKRQGKVPYPPDFVVWPETVEEVSAMLRLANARRVPVVPYGAGSGVCGGTLPLHGGIVVDLKKMHRILAVNQTGLTVTAQAGIIGEDLERALNQRGYTLGHFPSSMYCSSLGGWLAARAAGQLSSRYGNIEDLTLGLQVVLPSGQVIRTKDTPRSAAGPDLKQLFIGSEGTLGIITQATLRMVPYPESRRLRGVLFQDVHSGLEAIRLVMRRGLRPAAARLYDENDTNIALGSLGYGVTGCLLVLGFEGDTQLTELEERLGLEICLREGGQDLGTGPGEHWWAHRYDISYKQADILSNENAISETVEVATTWDKLEPLYLAVKASLEESCFTMAHFSHAYPEGCSIYFTVVAESPTERECEGLYRRIWQGAMEACLKVGGTITHHHGVGLLKAPWLPQEYGGGYPVLQELKKALDPNDIMNPGKLGLERG